VQVSPPATSFVKFQYFVPLPNFYDRPVDRSGAQACRRLHRCPNGRVRAHSGASENRTRAEEMRSMKTAHSFCVFVRVCTRAQGSIRAIVKERFLNVVREIQPANGWKVVVVDAASTKLISRCRRGGRGGGTAGERRRSEQRGCLLSGVMCMRCLLVGVHACGHGFMSARGQGTQV